MFDTGIKTLRASFMNDMRQTLTYYLSKTKIIPIEEQRALPCTN